jgi:hypothetical protein
MSDPHSSAVAMRCLVRFERESGQQIDLPKISLIDPIRRLAAGPD